MKQRHLRKVENRAEDFQEHYDPRIDPIVVLKTLRPHQWSKNVLLLLPAVMAHNVFQRDVMQAALIAFVAFSLCASAVYLLNDIIDVERDRKHPEKRHRPFASGRVPMWFGYWGIPSCLLVAGVMSYTLLPLPFTALLVTYFASTLVYTLFLNREPIVDVLLLTSFYVIRLLSGGAAVGVKLSPWFLAFTFSSF